MATIWRNGTSIGPPIEFYRPLPPLAYLPLTIIWFGIIAFAFDLLMRSIERAVVPWKGRM